MKVMTVNEGNTHESNEGMKSLHLTLTLTLNESNEGMKSLEHGGVEGGVGYDAMEEEEGYDDTKGLQFKHGVEEGGHDVMK